MSAVLHKKHLQEPIARHFGGNVALCAVSGPNEEPLLQRLRGLARIEHLAAGQQRDDVALVHGNRGRGVVVGDGEQRLAQQAFAVGGRR